MQTFYVSCTKVLGKKDKPMFTIETRINRFAEDRAQVKCIKKCTNKPRKMHETTVAWNAAVHFEDTFKIH